MYTLEEREAIKVLLGLSDNQIDFLEKAEAFADSRPAVIPDEIWTGALYSFVQKDGAACGAEDALGEALGAVGRMSKEEWRTRYAFGACLATVMGLINFGGEAA